MDKLDMLSKLEYGDKAFATVNLRYDGELDVFYEEEACSWKALESFTEQGLIFYINRIYLEKIPEGDILDKIIYFLKNAEDVYDESTMIKSFVSALSHIDKKRRDDFCDRLTVQLKKGDGEHETQRKIISR